MDQQNKCITLANDALEVILDPIHNSISVRDRRIGKTWEQLPFGRQMKAVRVQQSGNSLIFKLSGPPDMEVTLELTDGPELLFTIDADRCASFEKIYFPSAFLTPDREHYLLQTDSQGLLLPVHDTFYPLEEQPLFYCGGGPGMAWMGLVDGLLESGYMAIFETPFDAAVKPGHEEGLITFSPVWLPSMGVFGYQRKIRYVFFDKGGYVAQCKRYREYIWPENKVASLRDKQKRFPAIEKILGAVHIYVWDKARETDFAKNLKEAGIDKALLLWDPNHLPYPEEEYDRYLGRLGYAAGGYDLFSDTHPDSDAVNLELEEMPLKRNVFPGLFQWITSKKQDGTTYSNEFGTYVCPEAVRPEISRRIEKELSIYPHETCFIDVYQANGIYECYDQEHPLSRKQYTEAIIKNYRLLEDSYNLFIGSEFGADFANAHCVYAHGMMTLQRTWFGSEADQAGTVYYKGDWNDNPRPSIMLSTRTASGTYLKYSVNEYTRVPLYELVYHDAVVTSWRWEDCNHHCPEIWWKKDLFNILYGTAPLWSLDQEIWDRFRVTFAESYRRICPWLQQICYDELVSHRFVSKDRKIQETVFSSGKRAVVNFGDEPYSFEGQVIGSSGFIIINPT